MIKAVIFDLDGVLVDAVEIHYQAFNRAIQLFGFEVPTAVHGFSYNGLPTTAKLEMLSQVCGLPRGLHGFINEMKQSYTQELLLEKLHPSIAQKNFLKELRSKGLKLAVASNCAKKTVHLVLDKLRISPFFDVILSREDVNASKPDPKIYLECLKRLNLTAQECLIVEDSRPGVIAAKRTTPNVSVVRSPREVSIDFIENEIQTFQNRSGLESPVVEIVIPMAGLGSRFSEAGYQDPKPFIPVNGKPMIQWVVENLSSKLYRTHFTFIVNRLHLESYRMEEKLSQLVPGCNIVTVPGKTDGAACTVLLAMDEIAEDRPLLIANSDQYIDASIDSFLEESLNPAKDGMIMTFPATDKKWSYAKLNSQGLVTEVAEKKPISSHATVGIYFFKTARSFINACHSMIRLDQRTNGEFYVCPVYNELIRAGGKVGIFPIPQNAMHGLGTPEDLDCFLHLSNPFSERLAG